MCSFNSRVRGGRDVQKLLERDARGGFNSRVRGGRDSRTFERHSTYSRFNSRVRGGRDHCQNPYEYAQEVSTHASAGDATFYFAVPVRLIWVSTHASAGDATQK